jgi:hypothetical protein
MKSSALIIGLVSVLCLSLASCATWFQSDQSKAVFHCVIQSANDAVVIYEINLDGHLVGSGRTVPKEKGTQILDFITSPGKHELIVTAQGYDTWKKTVMVMGGMKYGQTFLIELYKSPK